MLLSLALAAASLAAPVPAPTSAAAASPEPTAPASPSPSTPAAVPLRAPSGSTQPYVSRRPDIGFISAGALRDRCQSAAPGLVSYCFAYITGVHDTVRAYETWLHFREFCPSMTGSQGDLRRAFLTYLGANPTAESAEAASVVVLALKDQYACRDPEPAKAQVKPDRVEGKAAKVRAKPDPVAAQPAAKRKR